MKRLISIVAVALLTAALTAADPDPAAKQSELTKLLHNTGELARFREDVKRANESVRTESRPDLPLSFWDELEREVSSEEYAQWVVEIYDHSLTEAQLREVNAVLGDAEKGAIHRELLQVLGAQNRPTFAQAVEALKRSHDGRAVDELITFMRSEAGSNFYRAMAEKEKMQKDKTIRLLVEAGQRVNARHK